MFQLFAKIGLDASGFQVGMKRVEGAAEQMSHAVGHHIKAAFAAYVGVEAIKELYHSTLKYGQTLADMADRLGVSTERLQEFEYAASLSGGTLEDFVGAMQKLAVARQKALGEGPGGDLAMAFQHLGVTFDELKKKRVDELLLAIGRRFKESGDPQGLIADSIAVMGRASGSLFAAMIKGLDESAEHAHKLGIVIKDDTIEKLAEAHDRMEIFGKRVRSTFAELFPIITAVGRAIGDLFYAIVGLPAAASGAASVKLKVEKDNLVNETRDMADTPEQKAKKAAAQALADKKYGKQDGGIGFEKILQDAVKDRAAKQVEDDQELLERAKKRAETAKKILDLDYISKQKVVKPAKGEGFQTSHDASDSLAKIGGFTGSADRTFQLWQEMQRDQSRVVIYTKQIADNTKTGVFEF